LKKYLTRMGDGSRIEMTKNELVRDFELGSKDAAKRGKIPELTAEDYDKLLEIFISPFRIVAVEPGNEIIMSDDAGQMRLNTDQMNSGISIMIDPVVSNMVHERCFCCDTVTLGHVDYSFKPIKPIVSTYQVIYETTAQNVIAPIFFGSMPNLGTYYYPDGPCANPSDLFQTGKLDEAKKAQEDAMEFSVKDMTYIADKMDEIGCDGINLDTVGAAGDADVLASLRAVEYIKANTKLSVEVGMAGEFILGMHGSLEYKGTRLAGLYPHQQVKVFEEAGCDIFGPVVNTDSGKSMAWNIARAVTFIKACSEASSIPIHPNVGMGVGGVPICEVPPIDCVTRASKAMAEIAKADGL